MSQSVEYRRSIRAVIWDIDDVLIDTTEMYRVSRRKALEELALSPEQVDQAVGVWDRLFWFFHQDDTENILLAIADELGFDTNIVTARSQQAIDAYRYVWDEAIIPVTETAALVRALCAMSFPQAVVSNGDPGRQLRKLTSIGLLPLLSGAPQVIAPSNSPLAKPHPAGILQVCREMNVSVHEAVYVGDRAADMIAANLARVIGVLFKRITIAPEVKHPPVDGALRIEAPRYIVHSVHELEQLLDVHTESQIER